MTGVTRAACDPPYAPVASCTGRRGPAPPHGGPALWYDWTSADAPGGPGRRGERQVADGTDGRRGAGGPRAGSRRRHRGRPRWRDRAGGRRGRAALRLVGAGAGRSPRRRPRRRPAGGPRTSPARRRRPAVRTSTRRLACSPRRSASAPCPPRAPAIGSAWRSGTPRSAPGAGAGTAHGGRRGRPRRRRARPQQRPQRDAHLQRADRARRQGPLDGRVPRARSGPPPSAAPSSPARSGTSHGRPPHTSPQR